MNAPAPVRARTVLVTALVVGLATYGVLRLWVDGGRAFPHPSYLELAALLLIGGTALVLGRRVRRMALGLDGPHLTPITAARTFVLAQASAVTGGALAGLHLAAAVFLGAQAQLTGTWSGVVRSAVLGVVAAALAAVGLVVQRWCRRPDEPRDRSDERPGDLDGQRPDQRGASSTEPGDRT